MSGAYHKADATVAAKDGVPVTPSDVTVFPVCRGLYIGTAGTLVVHMPGASGLSQAVSVTFANVPAGIFPIQADQVFATGTTAANIVALY